jgi:putative DNA methylase
MMTMPVKTRKKLIEVALPLEAINVAAAREKSIRHGHPSTLHLWWSRKPLAAARAVIFAQMVDDPSTCPELFPTEETQEQERQRLFKLIEELVKWENTNNELVLAKAREEICKSWRRACEDNKHNQRAKDLFNPDILPSFLDPFAGGGSLPVEAQRLGLDAYGTELNPVAVLINKAMIEIPPKFTERPAVNPDSRTGQDSFENGWCRAQGLAEDVRYYGKVMRNEAYKKIGHLYPQAQITSDMAKGRPDLKALIGQRLTVIAWLWARTVKSPNPAFSNVEVPLASTFLLSTKPGKKAYVVPSIEDKGYRFVVKVGDEKDADTAKSGTKLARGANFKCLMSGSPISPEYIKAEGSAGRMFYRLMAVVAEGVGGRVYLDPTNETEGIALKAAPAWRPETAIAYDPRALWTPAYGLKTFGDIFTPRQLVALTTFADLVEVVRQRILHDATASGMSDDGRSLEDGGHGATAYSDAVAVYLAFAVDRSADFWTSLCIWANQPKNEIVAHLFTRQGIPMTWGFAEANPFSDSGGNFSNNLEYVVKGILALPARSAGRALQINAIGGQHELSNKVISTDPPYYDNIGYADLSDFFYVWLRRSLRARFPNILATVATPKAEELVANPYRQGSKQLAEAFFLKGMTAAMHQLASTAHPAFPLTIYYAFKQAESDDEAGISSTGWETFLDALIRAGFCISGTWPVRSERPTGVKGSVNALASSIVLVCSPRPSNASTATRRQFIEALRSELADSLLHLQRANIAPVDLAQATIGPGMAIYTRFANVVDAEGKPMSVRDALALINQTLDEVLTQQEGDFDSDSRWALSWFEQSGFAEGQFGFAETLSKAKNTSVAGLVDAGILKSKAGKVCLLRPEELLKNWNPEGDQRLTVWEMVHHLIRVLESGGESAAAELLGKLGGKAEAARELAYRLYTLCERKKRAPEALSYNGLVQSWPEMSRLAREGPKPREEQSAMF